MKCENKGFVTYTACSEFDLKVYGLIWFTVINFLHLFFLFHVWKSKKKREYVVQVLMKVIPGMTVNIVVNNMQEAHINGLCVVIVCGYFETRVLLSFSMNCIPFIHLFSYTKQNKVMYHSIPID
ncbi:putative ribosomal protein L7/L12/adaptor protein ClpS [Helianthus annuus]|uniref:Ribosomal protein L7/L12/adaptor protein ClpS n=1 Tax=Helianthus annuus TaxID=4232 RepID=A0A9K3H4E1_HELAN|nr:putative ribosomal protein L7/L12/adaptor protein ClpS [Helianthus annuus]KAJ0458309.1 putative ribosomal protein L7/L12/adaptor protein ClpS [Helianthus annuus]KAJ0475074.1 putative ATP-dependent Clp protease adaptor protein ClpS [Helianthus annuus]KAJ0650630.1 putative ATP-dependent Clp protease adaptor protein ClpS [Helianthus annuus]KAJ0833460.1 putative ribosomal protein L7/L12/adaptor protein ClpS [Helianthus annuus]